MWYVDARQQEIISKSIIRLASKYNEPIVTIVAPAGVFTNAEGYHQKYYLQAKQTIMQEIALNEEALLINPLATRLNAYVAGHGSREMLEADMKSGALSKKVGLLVTHVRLIIVGVH